MKIWLSEHIYTVANVLYTHRNRATGLGASGAALSVWLFLGTFACSYFILTEKKHCKYWFVVILIFIAQILSGRTGLYLGVVNIVIVELIRNKKKKHLRKSFMSFGTILILIGAIVLSGIQIRKDEHVNKSNGFSEVISRNADISRIVGENSFFSTFLGMQVPTFSEDTFWGYGVVAGELNGESELSHDSGYIKRYTADGIFMAVIEYLILAGLLISIWGTIKNKKLRKYTIGLILMTFFIEIKEPFVYYYSGVAVMLCILILASKYNNRIINTSKDGKRNV